MKICQCCAAFFVVDVPTCEACGNSSWGSITAPPAPSAEADESSVDPVLRNEAAPEDVTFAALPEIYADEPRPDPPKGGRRRR